MKNKNFKLLIRLAGYSGLGLLFQVLSVGLAFGYEDEPQEAKKIGEVGICTGYENSPLENFFFNFK